MLTSRTNTWLLALGLALGASNAGAEINIFTEDVTTTSERFTSTIRVTGGDMVSSLNISVGTRQLEGANNSELVIEGFSTSSLENSIWSGVLINSIPTPPGFPATSGKVNNVIVGAEQVAAEGDVMNIIFDASGTTPGDVFEIDLNYDQRTSASSGATVINDVLTFTPARIHIDEMIGRLLGDVNEDGLIDVQDIDLLTQAVFEGSTDPIFDLNTDGMVDQQDRTVWVEDIKNTFFGDANLDLELNSSDLVQVLQAGQYEDDIPGNSTWATGDFDGNLEFDSGDLVAAFRTGAYENGPRAAVASVPEPTTLTSLLLAAATLSLVQLRRHK